MKERWGLHYVFIAIASETWWLDEVVEHGSQQNRKAFLFTEISVFLCSTRRSGDELVWKNMPVFTPPDVLQKEFLKWF